YGILPKSNIVLQVALVAFGGACAFGLARLSRTRHATRAVLSLGVIAGFLGFTLITPQIIEHFLIVYGALLIVFLVTMPDGMAGFLKGLPGIRLLWRQPRTPASRSVTTLNGLVRIAPEARRIGLRLDDVKMHFGGVK